MPDSSNCPFCNAAISVPTPDPISGKIQCPRCDETFILKSIARERNAVATSDPITAEVQRHRQSRQASGWRSPHRLVIVGIVLAALGVFVGLGITYWSREKKTPPPNTQMETAKAVAPVEMPGLRYLPAGTDSAIAVQFRPLLDALSDGIAKDQRALLDWIGLPGDLIGTLEKVVPVGLENVDQLVLGMKLKDGSLLKQIVLVVHTREAFAIDAIAKRLKAKMHHAGDRNIYQVMGTAKFPLDLSLWAPNDRVLLIALEAKDIEQPRGGIEHLAPRFTDIASTQFLPDTYFWAVLDSERWELLGLLMLGLSPEQRKAFESRNVSLSVVRTVTLAVRSDPEPALTVWFDLKSETTAVEFRAYLSERLKDAGDRVAVGGAGNRVMVRTPIQSGELRDLIQKLLPPGKK